MNTTGHLVTQPGLRGHSVDPDNNLLGRYLIHLDNGDRGYSGLISFGDIAVARVEQSRLLAEEGKVTRLYDNFKDEWLEARRARPGRTDAERTAATLAITHLERLIDLFERQAVATSGGEPYSFGDGMTKAYRDATVSVRHALELAKIEAR